MRKRLALIAGLWAACAAVSAARAAGDVTFEKLPTDLKVTTMALTEDAAHLVTAHEEDNVLLVWSVATGQRTRKLSCAAPRHVLARGGKVFVAQYGRGTIAVFSPAKNWQKVNELEAGHKEVSYLSAPMGEAYRGKLLATCGQGSKKTGRVIDVEADESHLARRTGEALLTFSANGRYVLCHAPFRSFTVHDPVTSLVRGNNDWGVRGPHGSFPLMWQPHPGAFWVMHDGVWGGAVPRPVAARKGTVVLGDLTRRMVYLLDKKQLRACLLDSALTPTGSRPARYVPWLFEQPKPKRYVPAHYLRRGSSTKRKDGSLVVHPALAATAGGKLYLFLLNRWDRTLHRAATEAFGDLPLPAEAGSEGSPRFRPVPTRGVVTCMAVSATGREMLIGCEQENELTVWDVAAGRRVQTLSCPAPRFILVRGSRAFVANFGRGTISVYSRAKGWKLTDQIGVDHPKPYYLSAPRGAHFRGKVLATCGGSKDRVVKLLDAAKDAARTVRTYDKSKEGVAFGVATFDYTGSRIIEQGDFYSSPGGKPTLYDAPAYLAGKRKPLERGLHQSVPLLVQRHPVGIWTAGKGVYAGVPPKPLAPDPSARLVIPDVTRPVYYVVTAERVIARTLTVSPRDLGSRTIAGDLSLRQTHAGHALVSPGLRTHGTDRTFIFTPPLATTIGGKHYLFLFENDTNRLMRCKLPAFGPGGPVLTGTKKPAPGEFPKALVAGRAFTFQLPRVKPGSKFTVLKGPTGVRISAAGVLSWKPAAADLGKHDIKIRVARGDELAFLRYRTEVLPAGVAVGPKPKDIGKHYLLHGGYHVTYGRGFRTVLVHNGVELSVLDAEGLTVTRRTELPRAYRKLFEREAYYVGLLDDAVELVSKATGKVLRRIAVPCKATTDLAVHPGGPVCYVAGRARQSTDRIDAKRIWRVDEAKAAAVALPKIYGQHVAVDPSGRFLYAALHDVYRSGVIIDWYLGDVYPAYGTIDVLACYDIRSGSPRFLSANLWPGSRGLRLRPSPDGRVIGYVCRNGHRGKGAHPDGPSIYVYDAMNVAKQRERHTVGKFPVYPSRHPSDCSFHPMLNWFAGSMSNAVRIFDRLTGKELTDRLERDGAELKSVDRILFSPSGRRLLVAYKDRLGHGLLQAFALKLTPAERARVARGFRPPVPLRPAAGPVLVSRPAAAAVVPARLLGSLSRRPGTREMSPKEIARQYMDSVVLVRTASGSGAGFCVGSGGYVLTCAHALSRIGDTVVSFRRRVGSAVRTGTVKARVLRVDGKNDLALLKITTGAAMRPVALGRADKVETGEKVSVIGHPGLGNTTLNYTMTTGIVSNPRQVLGGVSYLQTTAPVNPGSSGGPVFDGKGSLIGLVVLKGKIEAAGFAVPVDRVRAFLLACTKKPS